MMNHTLGSNANEYYVQDLTRMVMDSMHVSWKYGIYHSMVQVWWLVSYDMIKYSLTKYGDTYLQPRNEIC